MLNLLQNAAQAVPDRSREVWIATEFEQPDGEVVIEIGDQGVGMDDDLIAQISEPFVTTRRAQGGTGLGLSVSSRIVQEHGGRLLFDSTPGAGTRARVCLPASG